MDDATQKKSRSRESKSTRFIATRKPALDQLARFLVHHDSAADLLKNQDAWGTGRKLWAVAAVLAIFGLSSGDARAADCSGGDCTATSGGDTIVIDPDRRTGMYTWSNDGLDHLFQQWFWYRVGDTSERSLDTMELNSADASGDVISLSYCTPSCGGSAELVISVTYILLDNGANGSAIVETVEIRNSHFEPINDIHFFEYTDLDVNDTFASEDAEINAGGNAITQVDANGTTNIVVTAEPTPDRWQISPFAAIFTSLNDGGPTTLTDATSPLLGADITHAFEWEFDLDIGETFRIAMLKCLDESDDCEPVQNGASLTKELTSGSDEDTDAVVDLVVPVGESSPLEEPYDFTIDYTAGTFFPDAIVFDTVPAEWQVTAIDGQGPNDQKCFDNIANGGGGTVDAGPVNGKCNKVKAATIIEWNVEGLTVGDLVVDVLNRKSPSGRPKFKPASCGPIIVNDGAIAFQTDGSGNLVLDPPVTGDPVVVAGPTDSICLAAVEDPEGTLTNAEPSRSAAADHDGDGIPSFDEVCVNLVQTNPCDDDTDGDNVLDGVDQCPLQGTEVLGAVDANGCPISP